MGYDHTRHNGKIRWVIMTWIMSRQRRGQLLASSTSGRRATLPRDVQQPQRHSDRDCEDWSDDRTFIEPSKTCVQPPENNRYSPGARFEERNGSAFISYAPTLNPLHTRPRRVSAFYEQDWKPKSACESK